MAGSQTDLARLVVSLEARLDKFDKAMLKATQTSNKTAAQIEGRFSKMQSNLNRLGSNLLAGFSVGVIAAGLAKLVTEIGNLGDEAKKAGISVAQLQRLTFAALGSGVSSDQIVAAMAKLNLELGEAASKGNDLSKILKASGVALTDLQGDPAQALLKIVDLFNSTADAGKRSALASAAFGKGFKDLIPFLAQGSDEIRTKMGEAVVVGDALVKKFDELGDKIFELAKNWKAGIATQLSTSVGELERIVDLAEKLQNALVGAGETDPLGKLAESLGAGKVHDALVAAGIISGPAAPLQHHPKPQEATAGPALVIPKELTEEQKRSAREAEAHAKAIAKVIANLQLEIANLSRTAREQLIYNELAKESVDITSAQGKEIADLAGKFYDQSLAVQNFTDEMDVARDATKGFFSDLISGLREGASLTDTLSKAFSNLADTIINKLVNQAVDELLGKSGSPETGLLGQLLSGALKTGSAASTPSSLIGSAGQFGAGGGFGTAAGGIAPIVAVTQKVLGQLGKNNAIGSAGQFGGAAITSGGLTGVQKQIFDFFSGKGLAPHQIAGIIGNVGQESRFDPFARNKTGGDLGLFQWTGARKSAMLGSIGGEGNLGDVQKQLEFAWSELIGSEKKTLGLLKASTNVRGATGAFAGFERAPSASRAPFSFANPERISGFDNRLTIAETAATKMATSVQNIATTAQTASTTFADGFAPAISSVLQSVLGAIGGLGGGGTVGNIFTGRASGGQVFSGQGYVVGENGPELFVPKVPGLIRPNSSDWSRGSNDGIAVHVTPSKYFDVHVSRIAATGDVRTLNAATRRAPQRMSSFQKLGT